MNFHNAAISAGAQDRGRPTDGYMRLAARINLKGAAIEAYQGIRAAGRSAKAGIRESRSVVLILQDAGAQDVP